VAILATFFAFFFIQDLFPYPASLVAVAITVFGSTIAGDLFFVWQKAHSIEVADVLNSILYAIFTIAIAFGFLNLLFAWALSHWVLSF
jgi:hypothetical protein